MIALLALICVSVVINNTGLLLWIWVSAAICDKRIIHITSNRWSNMVYSILCIYSIMLLQRFDVCPCPLLLHIILLCCFLQYHDYIIFLFSCFCFDLLIVCLASPCAVAACTTIFDIVQKVCEHWRATAGHPLTQFYYGILPKC